MIARTVYGYPLQDSEQDWPPLPEQELRPLHRAVLAALGGLDGQRLLDVGCGVGLFLCAAEQRGALVAGTDTAFERLEIARWALPDADLRAGGLVEPGDVLPFDDSTFDVVAMGALAHNGTDRETVLTELVRVVRPGGRVAVGGWVRPPGGWAETFAGHLRGLGLLGPAPGTDTGTGTGTDTGDGLDGALRAAGLVVLRGGEVGRRATYASVGAAWTAMLGSEPILRAIRLAGEKPVRAAFTDSVAGAVRPDGVVCLPKSFRYVVAVAPMSTMWAFDNELDNESRARGERPGGRD
ncbi:class I SAM-dependent methyltransferase [Actinophytocola glycyrrhizae]|uniref:Class I SAM-dependent methyltransferase n=1 Tax=Actinophytocola glycyrrhizae TaxID=2044873 RepID=A0ABV9SCB8_9PSEU